MEAHASFAEATALGEVSSSEATVVYSTEPLWGTAFAFVVLLCISPVERLFGCVPNGTPVLAPVSPISTSPGQLGRAPQPQMIAIRPLSSARSLLGDLFSPGATVEGPDDQDYARVHEYMTPASQVVSLSPKMRLDDAACRLCEAGVSGAPVVGPCGITGERRLLGVLSQKDLLYSAVGRGRMRFLTSGPRSQRRAAAEPQTIREEVTRPEMQHVGLQIEEILRLKGLASGGAYCIYVV